MRSRTRIVVLTVSVCLGWAAPSFAEVVSAWNATIVACVGAGRPGPVGVLDIAIVHAAMHDAVQAIEGEYEPYKYDNKARRGLGSREAAAESAAYGMLVALYGSNQSCLASVPNPAITYAGDAGLTAGAEAVQQLILEHRPGFQTSLDPFIGGLGPGEWRPTPGVTAGANTFFVFTKPFALNSTRQFRPPPPPPLQSETYRRDYDEVKALGSLTGSTRTAAQTDVARFWTTPPPQLFAAVRSLATAHVTDVGESARLFALVSLAAADSQLTVFESKYLYNFWRPITAIQQGDFDNNPNTVGDPGWTPFLVTPPYPDYSSGANSLSGSMTTAMQLFFGTDELAFTISNVIGGVVVTRSYRRISELALEMVDARILEGIHFRSADEAARVQGSRVAHWIFQRFLRPVPGK